jgi:zinc protease
MGFLDDIKAMPGYYEYSLRFFGRFYRPENVVVLVVGDVDPEQVFALASRSYAGWEKGYQPPEIAPEPPQAERRVAEVDWPNPTRPHLTMGWHVPAFDEATADTAALDLVSQLLFSENAPLYQELVVDKQLVDFIGGGASFRRDPYLFTVTSRLRSAEALPEVEATLERYLEGLKAEPVERARLERIKSHLRYDFALALDSAPSVADLVAEFLHLTTDPESINRLYDRYQAVTPEDVQRVAREYFRAENQTVVRLAYSEPTTPDAPASDGEGAGEATDNEGGE